MKNNNKKNDRFLLGRSREQYLMEYRRKRKEMSTGGEASGDRSQPQLCAYKDQQSFCRAQLAIGVPYMNLSPC